MCINASIPITIKTKMPDVVGELLRVRERAEDGSLGVVYIGEKDTAENLIFTVASRKVIQFYCDNFNKTAVRFF